MADYTKADYKIYEDRLDALCALAIRLADDFERGASFDRRPTVVEMLRRLSDFARQHFDFFYDRLTRSDSAQPEPKLQADPRYPPESVFFAIITQVARDIEVITQAAFQRQHPDDIMQRQLKRADQLAYDALKPVLNTFLKRDQQKEPQTTLTYFQKARSIRMIPYAPVALVGIPYAVMGADDDFYAIPHEIGHYVFWHGNRLQKAGDPPLREQVRQLTAITSKSSEKWRAKWVEEIFADVYGCIVAGQSIAKDFQNLSQEYADTKFFKDDGDHPSPFIRPSIYHRVLERQNFTDVATELRRTWQTVLEARKGSDEGKVIAINTTGEEVKAEVQKSPATPPNGPKEASATLSPADDLSPIRSEVEKIVDAIYDLLNPNMRSEWLSDSVLGEIYPPTQIAYPYYLNDNAIDEIDSDGKKQPKIPDKNRKGSYRADTWRLWVFANGWTDGPNGGYNP